MARAASDSVLAWDSLRSFLPFDLDALAVETNALRRRRRVGGGESLLRALLLVALPKSTLERASRLAAQANVAFMSPVALFKRLSGAERFLSAVFVHLLSQGLGPEIRYAGYRLLAVDATSLSGPGAKGTDQRLHVVYDLGEGLPLSVELTDARGGETFSRHVSFGKGDLLLGDRGYGWAKSLMAALRSGARSLVRFEFDSIRLLDEFGEKILKERAEGVVPASGPAELRVFLPGWPAPLRAIGERNPAGEIVWLLTDLSEEELPLREARALYARRWQVELFFKRLKSLLDLDELPSRDGPTSRPWIWAKLILCALAVLVGHERFSPWGRGQAESLEGLRLRLDALGRGLARSPAPPPGPGEAQGEETPKERPRPRMPLEETWSLS